MESNVRREPRVWRLTRLRAWNGMILQWKNCHLPNEDLFLEELGWPQAKLALTHSFPKARMGSDRSDKMPASTLPLSGPTQLLLSPYFLPSRCFRLTGMG